MKEQKMLFDQMSWLVIGFIVASYVAVISVMLAGLTHHV